MRLLNDLKIGRRLGLAFALCIALSVLLAVYARSQFRQVNDELERRVQDRMVKVEQLTQLRDNA